MKIIKLFLAIVVIGLLGSCGEESLDSRSIFDTTTPEQSAFDKWLSANYTTPYNIAFNYRYDDKEVSNTYNLAPAEFDKSIALAKLMKHVWIDAYAELAGEVFVKTYAPRVMQLVGSVAYNSGGSVVLGTAEGGLKIVLYNVNIIDIDNPDLETMNYWFFHTMHHEFGHILQQTKNYPTDFNLISAADYRAGDWVNLSNANAPQYGFVTGYASQEANEDFVEILSTYVTNTPAYWEALLNSGGDKGKAKILAKFDIVKDYLKGSWQIDIDKLREIVQRRSSEIGTLDLRTLN
jgi:substrate import-associated zinc metallohydrolase lipoprotein